jgi:crotonobetainyl-CoA:carnitine CoA-transferase CaiB-like acyl-CoA transferase
MERLAENEVPAAQVNTLDQVFEDPQVVHSEIIESWDHPDAGPVTMAKPPVRWGTTVPEMDRRVDHLGESTHEVLTELGYDDAALAELRDAGVIKADT